MSTYTIGEVAERSGFSASALRYYEGIGLVAAPTRSASGYRMYDDHTLRRLAFIAEAKQLGCSLDEIADLVSVWDGDQCGPGQQRLHRLVTRKLAEAERQIVDLVSFVAHLRTVAAQLGRPASDGPCDENCACLTSSRDATLDRRDMAIACTLDPAGMTDRLAEWAAVLGHVQARTHAPDGALRLAFSPAVDPSELSQLVVDEQTCCSFLSFALTVDTRGIALEVRAPADADVLVAELFGVPDAEMTNA